METKPGYKTTEFWIGLVIPQILAILAVVGVFTPEQADALTSAIAQIAGAVISALSAFGYNIGRGQAKKGVRPKNNK